MTRTPGPDGGARGAYYRRLEVGPGASHDEIVRAYRRLALGVHPDAHPEDPEAALRFRQINEAYEVLGDPARREAYDGSGASRHIPVHRRHSTGGSNGPIGWTRTDETQPSPPPTILGASRLESVGDVPLRAGPVHIGPSSDVQDGTASFSALLFEIFGSWRRRQ
jgi:curved DNA-binding protein CbpA